KHGRGDHYPNRIAADGHTSRRQSRASIGSEVDHHSRHVGFNDYYGVEQNTRPEGAERSHARAAVDAPDVQGIRRRADRPVHGGLKHESRTVESAAAAY